MAGLKPCLQALGRKRYGIGRGDAHGVEADLLRPLDEGVLELLAAQKSRLS